MFGLDDQIAGLGDGAAFALVAVVAILLGLRHATDPDHLTAVTTLVAGEQRDARSAGRLGLAWGLGHATTLFAFGVPIVLFRSYLPEPLQMGAEAAVGVVIVVLALRLLLRWRSGALHDVQAHPARARTRGQAYAIGLVHGAGGSAGVGVLLLAAIPGHVQALVALALFALFTAVSMAAASTTFGFVLTREAIAARWLAVAPLLGVLSLAFGVWYALGAVDAVPYLF
jgi:hypothetical protein